MSKAVVIIAPHPDDEAIGCGGAILLHRQRGDDVRVVFLTSGERGIKGMPAEDVVRIREDEAHRAAEVLGVQGLSFMRLLDGEVSGCMARGAAQLAELFASIRPGLIYLPHEGEAHLDHQAALPLVRSALSATAAKRADFHAQRTELRAYEVWTPMERFGWPEDISDVMAKKLRAVRCYRSQLEVFQYDRAVRGLNAYRGCLAAKCRYAEVYRYTPYEHETLA